MAHKKERYRDVAVSNFGHSHVLTTANTGNVFWNVGSGGGGGNWNTTIQYTYPSNASFTIAEPARPKSKFGDDFDWLKKRVDEYINDFDRTIAA